MRTVALWLLLAAATSSQGVIGGGGSGLPQSPVPQNPPRDARPIVTTGTGSIRGRVTVGDTGAPIRRATVNLNGGPRTRGVDTDHEGRFEFNNLPAGTYTLMVNAGNHRPGYQSTPFGGSSSSSSPFPRGKPIELADGQRIDNLDVALLRTGVITGRVTDSDGEPAARVQVVAWILRPGSQPTQQMGGMQTDDLGHFRLFGLPPGDYIVRATPQQFGGGPADVESEPTGFAPTYAPGTPVRSDAMRLRVARGAQVSTDIRLLETRLYTISGTVLNAKGEATRNTNVMLARRDDFGGSSFGASVSPAGTFTIRNVPPGDYEVVARYSPPRESAGPVQGPDPGQEFASVKIDVSNGNVDGVVLAMRPSPVVTGQIVFEDETPEGRRPSLSAQSTDRQIFAGSPVVEVKDTTFTIRNIFSPAVIRGSVGGTPGWGLKAVLLHGKDITDHPTTFTAGDSGHLQVVFTGRAPSVEGLVTDDAGKPVIDASVLLFGHDPVTWQPRSSYFRTAPIAKDGKYVMNGLREGRYFAVALPAEIAMGMMNAAQPSAEFLESLSKVATAVTLNAGEKRPVDLRVVRFQEQ